MKITIDRVEVLSILFGLMVWAKVAAGQAGRAELQEWDFALENTPIPHRSNVPGTVSYLYSTSCALIFACAARFSSALLLQEITLTFNRASLQVKQVTVDILEFRGMAG